MRKLPDGWIRATIEDVTRPVKRHRPDRTPDIPFLYIDISSIDNKRHAITSAKRIVGHNAPSRARQLVASGDILLSTVRVYLKNAAPVPPQLDGATASTGFCVLRATPQIEPRFLLHTILSDGFVSALSARQSGTNYPAVRDDDVRQMKLNLPPLAVQRRIITMIEEQLTRLTTAESSLDTLTHKLAHLKDLILQEAIAGNLASPAHKVKLKDSQDQAWKHVRIKDIAQVGSGATPKRGNPQYWVQGTIPWVTSGQLNEPYVTHPAEFITQKALRETSVKIWPAHTLLVAMYGEGSTRGKCSELLFEATTNQACAAIVMKPGFEGHRSFLKLFLNASYETNRRLASGGVQPNLNLSLVKNLKVSLPPKGLGVSIVEQADRWISGIDQMSRTINRGLEQAVTLRQGILHRALSGQLVSQDPALASDTALDKCIPTEEPSL